MRQDIGDVEHLVYFVACGNMVKVGTTTDLERRLASLQTAAPLDLVLLGCVLGGRHMEKAIHRRLNYYHIRGEWFRLEDCVLHYIHKLCDARIPTYKDIMDEE